MIAGAALAISGLAFLIGAWCVGRWGPAANDHAQLYVAGGALVLLGLLLALVDAARGMLAAIGDRLSHAMAPNLNTSNDVAGLAYQIADKALASQAGQMQDLRGRIATLAVVAPAAAAVIVATTSAKFDLLAVCSLVLFGIAIAFSLIALAPRSKFSPNVVLDGSPPAGTKIAALHLVLADELNQTRVNNTYTYKSAELLFFAAAASFLFAVLMWVLHVATDSHVLFG